MIADELVAGIDTHKDVHVAAVLDGLGRRLAVRSFPAADAGNAQLVRWLDSLSQVTSAGVEGTGSYGYRLARALISHGVQVREVSCPDRARRRRHGNRGPPPAGLCGQSATTPLPIRITPSAASCRAISPAIDMGDGEHARSSLVSWTAVSLGEGAAQATDSRPQTRGAR